jgi:hypothetical protein
METDGSLRRVHKTFRGIKLESLDNVLLEHCKNISVAYLPITILNATSIFFSYAS